MMINRTENESRQVEGTLTKHGKRKMVGAVKEGRKEVREGDGMVGKQKR